MRRRAWIRTARIVAVPEPEVAHSFGVAAHPCAASTMMVAELAGGRRALKAERLASLQTWATATLPASPRVVGHRIETTCGVARTRSGPIERMAAGGRRMRALIRPRGRSKLASGLKGDDA